MAVEFREEHRREALIGAVVFHALLAALFIFTVFKGPDPPITFGGDGVELNYGIDEAGSGDHQTLAQANPSQNREDSRPPARNPSPQPQPVVRSTPTPPQPAAAEKIITSEAEESPVKVPPVEKAAPTPTPVAPREEVREAPPKPAPKPRTLYTPKGSADGGGNGSSGTSNTPTGNNNGDRPGSVGDQGDPRGSLNAKALYGQPGSGGSGSSPGSGGTGLEMSGWAFETRPRPPMIGNENGFARFRVKINDNGDVESVQKMSGNVSAAQVQACIDEIQRSASFKRTQSGNGGATGYITFRFETR